MLESWKKICAEKGDGRTLERKDFNQLLADSVTYCIRIPWAAFFGKIVPSELKEFAAEVCLLLKDCREKIKEGLVKHVDDEDIREIIITNLDASLDPDEDEQSNYLEAIRTGQR